MSIQIISKRTVQVEKWIKVKFRFDRKLWEFSIRTLGGKVIGDYENGFATADLKYFSKYSQKTQKKNYEAVKAFVEKNNSQINSHA